MRPRSPVTACSPAWLHRRARPPAGSRTSRAAAAQAALGRWPGLLVSTQTARVRNGRAAIAQAALHNEIHGEGEHRHELHGEGQHEIRPSLVAWPLASLASGGLSPLGRNYQFLSRLGRDDLKPQCLPVAWTRRRCRAHLSAVAYTSRCRACSPTTPRSRAHWRRARSRAGLRARMLAGAVVPRSLARTSALTCWPPRSRARRCRVLLLRCCVLLLLVSSFSRSACCFYLLGRGESIR
jgi:hypothetical protein